jgi:alpha-N-arabinofuranosidase
MLLSFDEWNVWFHTLETDKQITPWQIAPPQLEDVYTHEDALMVGCMLITLLKHADRVKIACLAQLVNVIAPIMTETGGRAWRQTIFYPYLHAARYARGTVLLPAMEGPRYDAGNMTDVPYVEVAAVHDGEGGGLVLFAVNRGESGAMVLDCDLRGFPGYAPLEHIALAHEDPKAVNRAEDPFRVSPRSLAVPSVADGRMEVILPPLSWNVIRLGKTE